MPDPNEVTLDNLNNPNPNPNPNEINDNTGKIVDNNNPDTGSDTGDEGNEQLTPEQIEAKNRESVSTLFKSFTSDEGLEDADKENRTQLLEKYKGTNFDENGNIIDKDGNVVANFDDIYSYLSDSSVTTDDKGNEVDAEGNVVRTAYEIAVADTVVNALHDKSSFSFTNEDGTPKIYSDDEAGFEEFTNDVSAERFENFKQEFFGQKPELAEIAKHILGGGTLSTFKQDVDYSAIDASTLSKEEKVARIKESLIDSGLTEERANSLVDLFKSTNTVDKEFEVAIKSLEASQTKRNAERDAKYLQAIQAEQQAIEQHWTEVQGVVEKGNLGDIQIPDNEKQAFFNYMSASVDDKGNSQERLDRDKETHEQRLLSAYLRFKGHDISKLVKIEARKEKVLSLKERIKQSAKIKQTPVNDASNAMTSGNTDISISTLLP